MREQLMKWRQGHIAETHQFAVQHAQFTHAVIISQDCDIATLPGKEPEAECVLARPVATPNPSFVSGKNPRVLHIQLADESFLEIDLRHRRGIAKEKLLEAQRSSLTLKSADVRLLSKWLGKRYSRPAFPDAFNRRLDKQQQRLSKLSKNEAALDISALFVSLDHDFTEELPDETPYRVIVWIACPVEAYEDPKRRGSVEVLAGKFEETLRKCDGIEVLECEVRPHADITLADLDSFAKLDFDYRSADEGALAED
jgi:hypothetical protein